jgi:hypothetical protein
MRLGIEMEATLRFVLLVVDHTLVVECQLALRAAGMDLMVRPVQSGTRSVGRVGSCRTRQTDHHDDGGCR